MKGTTMRKIILATIIITTLIIFGLSIYQAKVYSQNILVNSIQDTIGSVVHIINVTKDIQGSGVAWSEDIIVTAKHLVEGGTDFIITLNDEREVRATKIISSKEYDIGFIKLEEKVLQPAKFGSIKETVLGQSVYIIGSPYGKLNFNSVTLGIVSGIDREFNFVDYQTGKDYGWSVLLQTDASAYPGNSGSPIFTMNRKVRGILVGGFADNLIYAIPVDTFIDDLFTIYLMFDFNKYKSEEIVNGTKYY